MNTRTLLLLCIPGLAACNSEAEPRLYRCSALAEQASCADVAGPVCARVDTGIRCIQPPCPSSRLREYEQACTACNNGKVDVVFTGSCELLQQQLESGQVAQ